MVKVGLHVLYTDHYPFDFEVLFWNTCQYHYTLLGDAFDFVYDNAKNM